MSINSSMLFPMQDIMCFDIAELPVTVLKPLQDLEVLEGGSGMFECEFSKPDLKVTWFLNGKPVPHSYKFTSRNDGKTYRLLIKDASVDDAGPISCSFDEVNTSANLKVKGDSVKKKITNTHD